MDKETKRATLYFFLEVLFIVLTYTIVRFYKDQDGFAYGMSGFPTGLAAIVVFILNLALLLKIVFSYKNERKRALSFCIITTALAVGSNSSLFPKLGLIKFKIPNN